MKSMRVTPTHLAKPDEYLADDNFQPAKNGFAAARTLLALGKRWHFALGRSIAILTLGSLTIMVSAVALGKVIQILSADAADPGVWPYCCAVLLLETAAVVLQYYGRVGLASATSRILLDVRRELFLKLERLPMVYFDRNPLGRTLTRITNDVEGIEEFFGGTLARMVNAFISIVLVFVTMMATDIRLGSWVILAAMPALLFTVMTRAPVRNWLRVYKRQSAHINARLAEYLNGMFVIKVFGLEEWTFQRYTSSATSLLSAGIGLITWNSVLRPISMFLCAVPLLVILGVGGSLALQGAIAVGTLVAFVRLSERFSQPIRIISQEIHVFQESLTSCERVCHLLNEDEETKFIGKDGTSQTPIRGSVEFRNVSMAYQAAKPVLHDVSFRIEPGMKVGLVGPTGSGKTSALSLLSMLYPFQTGAITIDGQAIQSFRREYLRSRMGVVTQDVILFRGTLRDNLTGALTGKASATDAQILHAAQQTGLMAFIEKLPDGLDYAIVDGGENLSMGERQLIAFTRMLIKDPAILILDEATANIDEKSEAILQAAAERAMQGRTCFIIAHRLKTLEGCDVVIAFEKGRVKSITRQNSRELTTASSSL